MRTTEKISKDWLFSLKDDDAYREAVCDETAFRKVDLPHDWSNDYVPDQTEQTNGGGGYVKAGTGWYRKHISIPEVFDCGKRFLYFEGVYMDSTVYVNGTAAGGHGYGYTSFYVDITGLLVSGDNVISVRVKDDLLPNSRWYAGAGITRDVYLVRMDEVHFAHFGVRVSTNGLYPEQHAADLQIRAKVTNETGDTVSVGVQHRLFDAEGKEVSVSGIALSLKPGETGDCMTRPFVSEPHLWTDENPYLYTMTSTLYINQAAVDTVSTVTGIRTVVFDAKQGFLLNGKRVKIKGMCVHHDCGLTGAAALYDSWERRLRKLRAMGCNGIRCSHNPPVPFFLDLCDRMGFLVMDEAFDEWLLAKNKTDNYYSENLAYGSSMFFENHAEEDLTAMLLRDYNHPSVVIWSIGNEIPEQSSLDGVKILDFLQDICHREDSSRMVTSACDNIAAIEPIRTRREFENALDVVGYNYAGRWRERAETFYEEDKLEFPDRRMIGTENPSVGGIRGDYSLDNPFSCYTTQTMRYEPLWRYTVSHDFVAGDYLWTGIDYLGETRWPSRGAGCGPLDTAGFEKDSYYFFRSIWKENDITLHLLPHWNFPGEEGTYKTVICYTNCHEVKLYINGKYVGSRGFECPRWGCTKSWLDTHGKHFTTNDLHLTWDVVYEPGTLRAEGYIDGKLVQVEEVVTVGEMAGLKLTADRTELTEDGLLQVEISAVDSEGRFVPTANPMIHCEVEGPASLLGMDAGDLTDLSLYRNPDRKMFHGKLLAAIKPEGIGEIRVTLTTEQGIREILTALVQ